jgi:hypothetical protein
MRSSPRARRDVREVRARTREHKKFSPTHLVIASQRLEPRSSRRLRHLDLGTGQARRLRGAMPEEFCLGECCHAAARRYSRSLGKQSVNFDTQFWQLLLHDVDVTADAKLAS